MVVVVAMAPRGPLQYLPPTVFLKPSILMAEWLWLVKDDAEHQSLRLTYGSVEH